MNKETAIEFSTGVACIEITEHYFRTNCVGKSGGYSRIIWRYEMAVAENFRYKNQEPVTVPAFLFLESRAVDFSIDVGLIGVSAGISAHNPRILCPKEIKVR